MRSAFWRKEKSMMTPRQRRLQRAGLETVAAAPRKSWLGRFTPLNGIQSAWIKSLLTIWGERACVGEQLPESPQATPAGEV